MAKVINKTFPNAQAGKPYKECIEVSGTLPITAIKHNLGDYGSVDIVGNMVCVTIKDPQYDVDVSIELKGTCKTCEAVTVTGNIHVDGICECTPVSISPVVLPQLTIGSKISVAIPINGTPPIKSVGGSVPECMRIRLDGSMIIIEGEYKTAGDIKFGVTNDCSCAPVWWNWGENA